MWYSGLWIYVVTEMAGALLWHEFYPWPGNVPSAVRVAKKRDVSVDSSGQVIGAQRGAGQHLSR